MDIEIKNDWAKGPGESNRQHPLERSRPAPELADALIETGAEHATQAALGWRLAQRFAGVGLDQEIAELRSQPAQPADLE